jgi:hypothetical protein
MKWRGQRDCEAARLIMSRVRSLSVEVVYCEVMILSVVVDQREGKWGRE